MKQKVLTLIALIALVVAGHAQTATAPSGSGTSTDPYQVASLDNLYWLSQNSDYWGSFFVQTADIDASDTRNWDSGSGFSPIGNSDTAFTGNYNAKGHTITGLYINRSSTENVGLFGYTKGATIDSLGMVGSNIIGGSNVGAVVGWNYSSRVTNSYNTGAVSGTGDYVGGVVGINYPSSTVTNSYNTGAVSGTSYVGGVVGFNYYSSVTSSYNTGAVSGTGDYVGGIVGENNTSTVTNSYNTGAVSGTASVGGVVGHNNYGTLSNCYWDTRSTGSTTGIGVDNNSQTATGLTTAQMRQDSNFSSWNFDTTWAIRADSTYPALRGVSNNAPFAFADTIKTTAAVGKQLLLNDYDYETLQAKLVYTIRSCTGHYGSISGSTYVFNNGVSNGSTDTLVYRVGEVLASGDTLWGNQATSLLVRSLQGSGTATDPYQVATLADLGLLSASTAIWDSSFIQTADIDASDTKNWTNSSDSGFSPIGNATTKFTGQYTGQGHTITGLFIKLASGDGGLFGRTEAATIQDLSVRDGSVTGADGYTGGLIGKTDSTAGTVSNCSFSGTVSGGDNVGGLIGEATCEVTHCYSGGSVTGTGGQAGGLVGLNYDTVSYCYSTATVTGYENVGGLAGGNSSYSYVAMISNCYSTGNVTATDSYVGGLLGRNTHSSAEGSCGCLSTVTGCYSTGNVTGKNDYVGGLVGYNNSSTVTGSYSTGNVTGADYVGGLVGHNNSSTVSNSYSTGSVTATTSQVGGLVGASSLLLSSITNCYYNKDVFTGTTSHGTGLTTAQMRQDSNFSTWNFDTTWAIRADSTYPALRGVSDNAPFAFADTLKSMTSISLDELLANDYDYETRQIALVYRVGSIKITYGSMSGSTCTLDSSAPYGSENTVLYRVGEVIAVGDTLWGNQVTSLLVKSLQGGGTKTDPYVISTLDDLKALSETPGIWDKNFIQTADIDASDTKNWTNSSGSGFSPIGNATTKFTGTYKGKEHTITGLHISRGSTDYVGLFGYTDGATIDSLGMLGSSITGETYVGGVVGYSSSSSTVTNSYNTGAVSGSSSVGGVVGYSYYSSTVTNSYNTGAVSGSSSVGGVVGYNYYTSRVTSSYNTGAVSGTSNNNVGGVVGLNYNYSTVASSYNTGAVSGTGSSVSGVVGRNSSSSTVTDCYWDTQSSGSTTGIGTDDNSQTATGLTTAQMRQDSNFSTWNFDTTWAIRADSTYPALRGVSNNAPFAFADTIETDSSTISLAALLANDHDYETGQAKLVYTTRGCTGHYGSTSNGIYTFNDGVAFGSTDTLVYRVGEVLESSDTLWGNQATSLLVRSLQGSGTAADPYQVATLADLGLLSASTAIWDSPFIQIADIDASDTKTWDSGSGFSPIGNDNMNFTGNYNGQGHTIKNLFINRGSIDFVGLFGKINNATIDSLGLTGISVSGSDHIGGLVGGSSGSTTIISNCYATGNVSGSGQYVGCLVGYTNISTINNCYATGSVYGSSSFVGGLVGGNYRTPISNCYATASVKGSDSGVGGLVGDNGYAIISNCYATGSVKGSNSYTGGLVGTNDTSSITNCYYNKDIFTAATSYGTGLTTAQMRQDSSFSTWNFDTTWAIRADSTYPALRGVSDNAPFAFADTLKSTTSISLDELLANDYDYETGQIALVYRVDSITTNYGSMSDSTYTFNTSVAYGSTDTVSYRVGEVIAVGDTLWGNQATSLLVRSLQGSGTATDPYQVATLADLGLLSASTAIWGSSFIQTADIDASSTSSWDGGSGFSPIGNSTTTFTGSYNGKGHTITGLYISRITAYYVGLFGYTDGATIDSLGLTGVSVSGYYSVGGLVGQGSSSSSITYCHASGSISGFNSVGGLVGYNNSSSISHCHAAGAVVSSNHNAGGLVGYCEGSSASISNCHATASARGDLSVGGLAGCCNSSTTITNCYATGSASGSGYVGGLVGQSNSSTTSNCYATGNASSTVSTVSTGEVGGLVGRNVSSTISSCYATGKVNGLSPVGGLVGYNEGISITSSYYNNDIFTATTSYGTGLTTAQMRQDSNFSTWNFDTTWAIRADSTYPALRGVSDNAPFAFADTIYAHEAVSLGSLLANDWDYETGQAQLAMEVVSLAGYYGSTSNGIYTFSGNVTNRSTDTLVYRVGEVIAEGDTLWGNQAASYLIYNNVTVQEINEVACGSYVFNDTLRTISGTYRDTIITASQDSIVILALTINPVYAEAASITVAYGNSYTFGDTTLATSGTYTKTFSSVSGCDSTVTLTFTVGKQELTINENISDTSFAQGSASLSYVLGTYFSCGGTISYTATSSDAGVVSPVVTGGTLGLVSYGAGTATITITATAVDADPVTMPFKVTITTTSTITCETITITGAVTPVACNGTSTGGITLGVSGGTEPYTYRWNNTSSSSSLVNIPAGSYAITVTDSLSCTVVDSFEVAGPAAISVSAQYTSPSCSSSDGVISLAVSGGTSPYTYAWGCDSTGSSLSGVAAGTYPVTVTDAAGCAIQESFGLSNSNAPVVTVDTITASSCKEGTGAINISVGGGTAPYTYAWGDGATAGDRSTLAPGIYYLTVTDSQDCKATTSATVASPTFGQPEISLVTVGEESGKNIVVWLREETDAIDYYTVYRETVVAGAYEAVGTVPYSQTSIFADPAADPAEQSWRYRLSATDYCGAESPLGSEYKTMYLQQNQGLNGVVNLVWDSYEGTDYYTYSIYRASASAGTELVKQVSASVNRWTDKTPPADLEAYTVAIDLPATIDPSSLKSDSGPYSQSLSNMAESELLGAAIVGQGIRVSPNPSKGTFTIDLGEASPVIITLVNTLGQELLRETASTPTITVSKSLPAGVYTLLIQHGGTVTSRQVVIQE